MEINGNKVTFELTEKEIEALEHFANLNGQTPDMVFRSFLSQYCFKAERRHIKKMNTSLQDEKNKKIIRWANIRENPYHRVIRAYFLTRDEKTLLAKKADMEKIFYVSYQEDMDHYLFIKNFYTLSKAKEDSVYHVLSYDEKSDMVSLIEDIAQVVEEHKTAFLRSKNDVEVALTFKTE